MGIDEEELAGITEDELCGTLDEDWTSEELDTVSTLDEELDAGTSFFATPAAANSGA